MNIQLPDWVNDLHLRSLTELKALLKEAIELNATDIHIADTVRLRINTRLQEPKYTDIDVLHNLILDIVKLIKAKQGIKELHEETWLAKPSDGNLDILVDNIEYKLRIHVYPSKQHLCCFIRLYRSLEVGYLNGNPKDGISYLQLHKEQNRAILSSIRTPGHLNIVAGTSGSGKSTLLYALMNEINKDKRNNIISIEAPVAQKIPYINQIEVTRGSGTTFSQYINAALRADPDHIVIGQMNNAEVATNAASAAITGHTVLGVMTTYTPEGALERFLSQVDEIHKRTVTGIFYSSLIEVIIDGVKSMEAFVTYYPFKYEKDKAIKLDHTDTIARLQSMKIAGKITEATYYSVIKHYLKDSDTEAMELTNLTKALATIKEQSTADDLLLPILLQLQSQITKLINELS